MRCVAPPDLALTSTGRERTIEFMLRALLIAALLVMTLPASDQALSVLHIKVVLIDADRKSTPVPRHALLVSDNPATAAPRLIITGTDGTADVNLRPGTYTVESDRAVTFHSKSYSWTQTVDDRRRP